jgi:Short C-terminal domain
VREFPDAVRGDAMRLRAAYSRLPTGGPRRARADDATVDRLERLAALREQGALTEEEYQAEKAVLLT